MLLSGGLRSSKSSHCFHQLFCGLHVFTGNKDTPSPNCAKRTEERGESTGQGSAAHTCSCQTVHEGGQSFSLSSLNSHRAKSRGAGTTELVVAMGLAHLTLLVVEDAGQSASGLLGSSVSRDWAVLAVFIPWQINCLEHGMWFFLLPCPYGVVRVPLFPQVITVWMLLFSRICYFTSIYIYVQG